MITLEEAMQIGTRRKPLADSYQEYEDAYEFFKWKPKDAPVDIGGGNMPIIVMKEDGSLKTWADYYLVMPGKKKKIGRRRKIKKK